MHELAVCQSVLRQVLDIATSHGARQISRITLRIGPLAGVEADLLRAAFPLVAAGTPCAGAVIEIEEIAVRVRCHRCGETSPARHNRLLCLKCQSWQVVLTSGDNMLLHSIEMLDAPATREKETT